MTQRKNILVILISISILINLLEVNGYALPGKYDLELDNANNYFYINNRGYFNNTEFMVKLKCNPGTTKVKIGWVLRQAECIDEFYTKESSLPLDIFKNFFNKPNLALKPYKKVKYIKKQMTEFHCEDISYIIDLYTGENLPIKEENVDNADIPLVSIEDKKSPKKKREANSTNKFPNHKHLEFDSIANTWQDGIYLFILNTEPVDDQDYSIKLTISLKHTSGYLSATDWPFLPFYSVMCVIYSLFAIYWFSTSFVYWRDLLRVQVWIGGVIILGLMEKAAYLAEYDSVNRNGYTLQIGIIIAEVISCLKRSLARMLVIIVSLGFGIVKPRLGPLKQKIVAVGALYFVFSLIDGIFRILDRKEDIDSKGVLAGVPLLFIDVSICYWILSNLQQTMRNLRVRRNIPKLTLFRHFTNTLIFCVIASTVFILWSLAKHKFVDCLRNWKELWLDEAFWHILFSFILFIIIILWRPSNNAQRFAFSPLLDDEDEEEFDQEMETEIFDSVKMRNAKSNESSDKNEQKKQNQSIEDDLKWVEENVPTTLTEAALPGLVDSDEEIANTKFEISKMD